MFRVLLISVFFLDRYKKRLILLITDGVLLTLSYAAAVSIETGNSSRLVEPGVWFPFMFVLPFTLYLFVRLGLYRAIIRYIAEKAIRSILVGVLCSAFLLAGTSLLTGAGLPVGVFVIYSMLSLIIVAGIRFTMREFYFRQTAKSRCKVVVYGAGEAGRQLLNSLKKSSDFLPVGFIDDDPELVRNDISGLRVHAPSELSSLVRNSNIEIVLLAVPSASAAERKKILTRLEPLSVRVQSIPGLRDILSGEANIEDLRDLPIDEILGRNEVEPIADLIGENIFEKNVLVTGGGGSIGGELCRLILMQRPRSLVILDNSEYALYAINEDLEARLLTSEHPPQVVPVLGSVTDGPLVERILNDYRINTVFHAAAYKHVPLVEANPVEGIKNNVFGTLTVAKASGKHGVGSFVLISTDKAVRPTNIMGASKRVAELVCLAMGSLHSEIRFDVVRFGNVVGSSGSVIPKFQQQISDGGPITVTHPDVTRFFMSIPEAAQLVIQAGALNQSQDVFFLDMGKPMKIVDLASRMARFHGYQPVFGREKSSRSSAREIEIKFVGLRMGEKMTEELFLGNNPEPTRHPKIKSANDEYLAWSELQAVLAKLLHACEGQDLKRITDILKIKIIGYQPLSVTSRKVEKLNLGPQRSSSLPDGAINLGVSPKRGSLSPIPGE